jgi:23S rRNA pseudouridine2457 synthase
MLSQFTQEGNRTSLKDLYDFPSDVYPVGRLDADSEGLLILTNDTYLNNALLNPKHGHNRKYLVQVDGQITDEAIRKLQVGVEIKINKKVYHTQACKSTIIEAPNYLPERIPPVRYRANIPTSWIELNLTEGKNRQVRKMTAKVGFPTLRLVRSAIEDISITHLNGQSLIKMEGKDLYSMLRIVYPH